MSALSKISTIVGAEQLERYNGLLSAKIMGGGAPGVSSGDAIKLVEEIAAKNLPDNYQIAWTAQAYQEKRTGSAAILAFSFAIIMVFLILAAQFETWGAAAGRYHGRALCADRRVACYPGTRDAE